LIDNRVELKFRRCRKRGATGYRRRRDQGALPHPRSDTVSSLRGRINSLMQSAEKATGETQAALIEKTYELLRNICEVIVEQELLQGVTERYRPNVRMTSLSP
jgi:hypothetical protein